MAWLRATGHAAADRRTGIAPSFFRRAHRRYGDEEFALVMPDTDLDALAILEQLKEAFAQIVCSSGAEEFSFTLSVGVASRRASPDPGARQTADSTKGRSQ